MLSGDSGQFYRRRLPHWQPDAATVFVTYRLANSLPEGVLAALREEQARLVKQPPRRGETEEQRTLRLSRQSFALVDKALATATDGVAWLAEPRVASLVQRNLWHWDGKRYRLHRYVIMPNHVHILIEPLPIVAQAVSLQDPTPLAALEGKQADSLRYVPLRKILQSLKGYTARHANKLLRRTGPFWQRESYDHWVRDQREYARIVNYIDSNPVNAGLCKLPEQWPWSSTAGNDPSASLQPS